MPSLLFTQSCSQVFRLAPTSNSSQVSQVASSEQLSFSNQSRKIKNNLNKTFPFQNQPLIKILMRRCKICPFQIYKIINKWAQQNSKMSTSGTPIEDSISSRDYLSLLNQEKELLSLASPVQERQLQLISSSIYTLRSKDRF